MDQVAYNQSPLLQRKVEPKGHLLSDNDHGVDHLGYSIYAEALAQLLLNVQTPITVGVFAPWGSGKSFLLREVRYLLQKSQNQKDVDARTQQAFNSSPLSNLRRRRTLYTRREERRKQSCSCAAWTFFLLSIICLLVATLLIALNPSMRHVFYETVYLTNDTLNRFDPTPEPIPTDDPNNLPKQASIGFFAVVLLLSSIGIVFVMFVCCVATTDSKCWSKTTRNFRLVAYSSFTTLPTLGEKRKTAQADYDIVIDFDEDAELSLMDHLDLQQLSEPQSCLKTKYIFVNFKAWEYAGSDTLWAGIVTNLTEAIEAEFGVVTSRLFRMLDIEEVSDYSKCSEPSTVLVQIMQHNVLQSEVRRLMTQFGVVLNMEHRNSCWLVQYSNSTEARNALKSLRIAGFSVNLAKENPVVDSHGRNNGPKRREKVVSIEMDSINSKAKDSASISSRDIRRSEEPRPESFCSHFLKYPKKVCCGCPYLYFCILFIIAIVLFPIGVCILISQLHLDVLRTGRAIPMEVQILAWMPATAAALVVILRFCWAMFKSQTRRVNQALSGAKGSMAEELGFMSKVKDEIKVIEKLVRCLRFTHQQNYKIVISIDDLDRCPHEKVKSVLEAVSILLSDRSSPFVCLIALDSRVAVKCIEEGMGLALLKANVNGHEYLKKIINLPFCLPELDSRDKRRYMAGMMDQADRSKLVRKPNLDKTPKTQMNKALLNSNAGDIIEKTLDSINSIKIKSRSQTSTSNPKVPSSSTSSASDSVDGVVCNAVELSGREFLFMCRKYLHDDEIIKYHLTGNPRNMKRIFNVISMTTQLIQSLEAREKRNSLIQRWTNEPPENYSGDDITWRIVRNAASARDLVRWVILTDQWPYRMSYLLQVIEDADQRSSAGRRGENIEDSIDLAFIYEQVVIAEIRTAQKNQDETTLLSLDSDPDLFLGFLRACSLTKLRAVQLKSVTVNLDQSLRHNIALYRSLVDLQSQKQKSSKSKES